MFKSMLTGGFLKGYRTYVLASLLLIDVAAKYLMGDIGLQDAIGNNWEQIAIGFGLLTAADHE